MKRNQYLGRLLKSVTPQAVECYPDVFLGLTSRYVKGD